MDKSTLQRFKDIVQVLEAHRVPLASIYDSTIEREVRKLAESTILVNPTNSDLSCVKSICEDALSPMFALKGAFHREWNPNCLGPAHIRRVIPRAKMEVLCRRLAVLANTYVIISRIMSHENV
jgi:hypothetical protein